MSRPDDADGSGRTGWRRRSRQRAGKIARLTVATGTGTRAARRPAIESPPPDGGGLEAGQGTRVAGRRDRLQNCDFIYD